MPQPQFLHLANEAYSKAVSYQLADVVRAGSTQRDEIKKLLASFRADSLTKVLVTEVHAPVGTRVPLSAADVASILKVLQAMDFTVLTPTEYENALVAPMMGGGVAVYMEQGSLRCEISHGTFFTVQYGTALRPTCFNMTNPTRWKISFCL